jgi:hypothetical protein
MTARPAAIALLLLAGLLAGCTDTTQPFSKATIAPARPPPLDHLAQAGPGAEQEIDYETLHGPGRSESAEAAPTEVPMTTEADAEGAIQGVAITRVTGAGEAGNGELAGALARVLTDAGWPVQDEPRENALMIEGDVALGEPTGQAQKVTLRWTVKAPDGQVLGAVEQANDVPAGSLDESWGEAADHAAMAAAQGIFDLVDKLR